MYESTFNAKYELSSFSTILIVSY